MSTNTTTTITDATLEGRRRVQGIEDNDGGGSRSTTGLADWKRQWTVDFPCFQVSNSNTVSHLSSRCLVLIFFIRFLFICSLHEILSVLQSYGGFLLSIKMYVYPQHVKLKMRNPYGAGTTPLSEVGTSPPHDQDTSHKLVSSLSTITTVRMLPGGNKKLSVSDKEYTASPTAVLESMLLTAIIDAE